MISIIGDTLYQWDLGRKVKIEPKITETVDFVHFNDGSAVEVRKVDDYYVADIPNVLLQSPNRIIVYAVIVSEDEVRTTKDCWFNIRPKEKPNDYVYTETEVFSYKALEERVRKLEETGGSNAVQSVNGKTGKIELTAEDVGALPADIKIPEVPDKLSAFKNDVGYLTEHQSLDNYVLKEELPSKVSELENDIGYAKQDDVGSALNNKVDIEAYNNQMSAIDKEINSKADTEAVNNALKEKADETDIPTKVSQLENDKGYLTEHQSLEEYAKKSEIPTKVSELANDKGYLTEHQDLSEYAKTADVNSELAKKSDEGHTHDERYFTQQQTTDKLATKQNKLTFDVTPTANSSNPVTSGGVRSAVDEVVAVAQGKCKAYVFDDVVELDLWLTETANTTGLNTGDVFYIREVGVPDYWWDKETASKQILETTKVDLTKYATIVYVDNKLAEKAEKEHTHDGRYYTKTEVDDALSTKAEKSEIPTKVSQLSNDSGYLTQHQDLSSYAKTTEVDGAIKSVEAKIPTKTSQLTNDSGFLTQHQSLAGYAKTADIPTKTSQLTNDSGFLTQHQSLSGYAKTSDIPTKVSELDNDAKYLTSVPAEYVTETELANKKYLTSVPSEYVTETELEAKGYAKTSQIPSIPSSLPANGGNADTVGGYRIVVSSTEPTVNDPKVITIVI